MKVFSENDATLQGLSEYVRCKTLEMKEVYQLKRRNWNQGSKVDRLHSMTHCLFYGCLELSVLRFSSSTLPTLRRLVG